MVDPRLASQVLTDSTGWMTLWASLLGAIVGAVVGGTISYLLARKATKEARSLREEQRKEHEKVLALKVSVKVGKIASSLRAFHKQTEQQISEAEAAGITGPYLYAKMLPMIGTEKRIHFDAEELALFMAIKDNEILADLMVMDDRYNSLAETFGYYGSRRTELTSHFPAVMSGTVGSTAFTPESWAMIAPRIVELDQLALSLRSGAREYYADVAKFVPKFGPKMVKYFNDPTFPIMGLIEDVSENSGAQPGG